MLVVANCQRARSLVIHRRVYARVAPAREISPMGTGYLRFLNLDRKRGAVALARREQPQALAAAQRVGGSGHRLEADEVTRQRCVELRIGIAVLQRELEPPRARG